MSPVFSSTRKAENVSVVSIDKTLFAVEDNAGRFAAMGLHNSSNKFD
jgi:hypothetical protein